MRSVIAEGGGARSRLDRVAAATCEQMKTALIVLIDVSPDAFDYAMDAAESGDENWGSAAVTEAGPACAACGGSVGIFAGLGLDWRHFAGDGTTAGQQRVYDPGHVPVVAWPRAEEFQVRQLTPVPHLAHER
jgi:hypothetical protein